MPEVVTVVGIILTRAPPGPWSVVFQVVGWTLIVVGAVWGGEEAKRKQKEAEDSARRAYNESLKGRTATIVSAEAPFRYVYGRARVGSAIVAMLTSGTRDEYKHLVCIHAAHECDAIEEIYIGGKALGTLDGNGDVTSGDYFKQTPTEASETFTGTGITLAHTPINGSVRLLYQMSDPDGGDYWVEELAYTLAGDTISAAPSNTYTVNYSWNVDKSFVRVKKHLGVSGDPADATLIADIPDKWDVTKTLDGFCYTVVRLNLDFQDFQSGAPSIEVLMRGKKLHDVRDGAYPADTAVWSQNPVLAIADYLTSEMCAVPYTDLPLADYITAANVCDETRLTGCTYTATTSLLQVTVVVTKASHGRATGDWVSINIESGLALSGNYKITVYDPSSFAYTYSTFTTITTSGNANVGGLYTINGAVDADQSQPQVLEKMAQCMAGTITATTWGITAGKYVAPVMALSQSDIVGDMSYTPGMPQADLYNGVKGQYISADNLYVPTDFAPYQNTAYVTADGAELWTDVAFPFTDTKQRVHNLCRIYTEDQRNGFTIEASFSYKCWALQVGQRVTFTSTLLGQTAKVYRVMRKTFAPDTAVLLSLKEDAESIWDFEDAVTADSTPNTDLPNPFYVPPPGNVLVAEALYETTNSSGVKVKATVTWDAPADVNVLDYTIEYKRYEDPYFLAALYSSNTQVEIFDIDAGRYDFRVSARNHLNLRSAWSNLTTVNIYGLTTPPADITNFTLKKVSGVAVGSWDLSTDLDVRIGGRIVVRQSALTSAATWNDGYVIEEFNGDAVSGIMDLITGTYMIKARDSSGNYSENMVSFVLTEGMITGFTTVGTSTQAAAFTGSKTNLSVVGSALQLTDPAVSLTGEYLFDTYMDLTTVATRRIEADIAVYSFTTTDLIDSRTDLIDDWSMFDGGVINDTDVSLYAALTDDDPVGTPTWSDWTPFFVSDFTFRAIKFKLNFSTRDATHNIACSALTVHAKIPA